MNRNLSLAACLLVAVSMLGGCGYLRSKFGNKPDAYKKSTQVRPLEVPPDLDRPNSSGALAIPEAGSAPAPSSAPGTTPPAEAAPAMTPPARTTTLDAAGLRVEDNVPSTWTRVGLALERSGAATIRSRDESARSYEVTANATTSERPGWFKRAITFGRAGNKNVSKAVALGVRVSADGDASRVIVDGAADADSTKAARDLLEALRQRLN